jgi:hypothetical protein
VTAVFCFNKLLTAHVKMETSTASRGERLGLHILTVCRIPILFSLLSRGILLCYVRVQCQPFEVPFFFSWGVVRLSPVGTLATIWPDVPPVMICDYKCGAVGGRSGRGNRSTQHLPQYHFVHNKAHMT